MSSHAGFSQRSLISFFNLKTDVSMHVSTCFFKGLIFVFSFFLAKRFFNNAKLLKKDFLWWMVFWCRTWGHEVKTTRKWSSKLTTLGNACVINLMINEAFWWVLESCAKEKWGTTIGTHEESNICSRLIPFNVRLIRLWAQAFGKSYAFVVTWLPQAVLLIDDEWHFNEAKGKGVRLISKRRQSFAIARRISWMLSFVKCISCVCFLPSP